VAVVLASPLHGSFAAEVSELVRRTVGEVAPGAVGKVPLIIHATGGTTWDAVELATRTGAKAAVLVGFGEHNSFASALHTRAELEAMGIPAVVFHCPTYAQCEDTLKKAKRVADAASALLGAKALLIGRETAQAAVARQRFQWDVEVVSIEDFEKAVEAAPPDSTALKTFGDEKVAKITATLRSLAAGRDLAAIQCFPYLVRNKVTPCLALALLNAEGYTVACEGDLAAGFAMLMSRRLTGRPGWIANVVYAKGRQAAFAHCTISLDMVKSWRTMPHFESGYPYGLSGELVEDVYTAVSLSPKIDKIAVGVAKVLKSGNFMERACRTQALVEIGDVAAKAPANHHVFIPGDVAEEVKAVAKLLKLEVVEY